MLYCREGRMMFVLTPPPLYRPPITYHQPPTLSPPTPHPSRHRYQINQLTHHKPKPLIKLTGTIHNHPAVFMIDCGATNNFINTAFINHHNLSTTPQPDQTITLADGSKCVSTQILSFAPVHLDSYTDTIDLITLPLNGYDAILGMNWLTRINPRIDWKHRTIHFHHADQMHKLRAPNPLISNYTQPRFTIPTPKSRV